MKTKTTTKSPKTEAAVEQTPASRLIELAESGDVAVTRALARNIRTPPKALEHLSHSSDKATRQGVAGNPNSPPKVLQKLGAQFPVQLLANPALDMMVLENPGLFSEVPEETLTAIAKREGCPPQMLGYLARAGHGKGLLMSLLQNGSTPESAIRYLMATDAEVLAERYEVPEDSMRKIKALVPMHFVVAGDLDETEASSWFWSGVAERLAPIAKDDGPLLCQANVPRSVLHDVIAWNVLLGSSEAVLANIDLPAPVLEVLAVTGNKRLLAAVKKARQCPAAVQSAADPDDARRRILESASSDASDRREWIETDSLSMQYLLSDHPRYVARSRKADLLLQMAHRMAESRHQSGRDLIFIAGRPEIDERVCEFVLNARLGLSGLDVYVAQHAISELSSNPATPRHVLSKIFRDSKDRAFATWTLEGLAGNRSTPPEILESLAGDSYLAQILASNPSSPTDFLEKLARERSKEYGHALFKNQALPEDALVTLVERMSGDDLFEDEGARWVVAHANCSGKALDALIRRESSYRGVEYWDKASKSKAAKDERLSERSLLLLAADPEVCLAVAKNAASTIPVLEKLLKKRDPAVRKAAGRAIKQRAKLASKGA